MSPSSGKKKSAKKKAKPKEKSKAPESLLLDPLKTGMPALDSIISISETKVGKKVYQIIETNEVDEYDKPKTRRSRKR